MKKSACLILGACLLLQAVPSNRTSGAAQGTFELASEDLNARGVPLYHNEHARELLPKKDFEAQTQARMGSKDFARFIHKRTKEMLPVPFRPQSKRIARALIDAGNRYQMDPMFLMAVIMHESRFNPKALGGHGEIGLMQIKPSTALWVLERQGSSAVPTAERMKQALKDPAVNIRYGTAYLAFLRQSFKRNSNLYLSAYNMGAFRVRSHLKNGVQPTIYRDKVMAGYMELTRTLNSHTVSPRTRVADRNDFIFRTSTFDL